MSAPERRVMAWARRWHADGETPMKEPGPAGRLRWALKYTFLPETPRKLLDDDVALYADDPIHPADNGTI